MQSPDSSDGRGPRRRGEQRASAEIARLAALGLSNREIGSQLFLSHRTVGAHLYRIFPKLGVTGRGQLHTVFGRAQLSSG